MNLIDMCQQLPHDAPDGILRYALKKHLDQLGGEITVYKRISATLVPRLTDMLVTPQMAEEYETRKRNAWVAECTCSVCGEVYLTDWIKESRFNGIGLIEGEDGLTYPCLDDYDPAYGTYIRLSSGDEFLCPYCACVTTLKHKSAMSGGRTWKLLIASVGNVGIYTTVFYWLVSRCIDDDGSVFSSINPWQAYALDESGRLQRFIYDGYGNTWRYSSSRSDAFFSKYPSMDGGLYNYRMGGWTYDPCPSLVGCTGEKTGLYSYIHQGGQTPVLYLKTWLRHKNIENLCNAGWVALLEDDFDRETNSGTLDIPCAFVPGVNWAGNRPYEMLRMDRNAFRQLMRRHDSGWSLVQYEAWLDYLDAGGGADALQFDEYYGIFKQSGVKAFLEMLKINPGIDFPKLHNYLLKQRLQPDDATMLLDTWRMTMRTFGRKELTSEEYFPRNLFATHERMSRLYRLDQRKDDWTKFLGGFLSVREKLQALEWTDGELCVVLPKDNGDLIREGDVLRHCVYSYGEGHVSGQHTIFFVRKYRRPERCYYTLDVNMTDRPVRQQLHGYGNEHHGPHKEYTHSIPAKVTAFVDRWEREVLMPWYAEQQKKQNAQGVQTLRKERKTA